MAQLWGGRFTKETDELVYKFNASINFDKAMINEDVEGSIAHATMLARTGIITKTEGEAIIEGLKSILKDVNEGRLEITDTFDQICFHKRMNVFIFLGDL